MTVADSNNAASKSCSASGSRHSIHGIFRVQVSADFNKLVRLPEPRFWNNHLHSKDVHAFLCMRTGEHGLLFDTHTDWRTRRCVLTKTGLLIVYVNERKLKGYAVKLSEACEVKVSSRRIGRRLSRSGDYNIYNQLCKLTFNLRYSSISVCLYGNQIPTWREALLSVYEGNPTVQKRHASSQTQKNDFQSARHLTDDDDTSKLTTDVLSSTKDTADYTAPTDAYCADVSNNCDFMRGAGGTKVLTKRRTAAKPVREGLTEQDTAAPETRSESSVKPEQLGWNDPGTPSYRPLPPPRNFQRKLGWTDTSVITNGPVQDDSTRSNLGPFDSSRTTESDA